LLIMLFDNSGSVTGGNDPIGNRYLEAAIALDKVGRRCRCENELAAVLSFDTPTSGDVPPTPINGKNRAGVAKGLAAPPDGGGCSLLTASLHAAQRIAHAHPDHLRSLLVFSDFELLDPDPRGLLEEFAAFPGDVHAIVLRSTPPQQLVDHPRVTVTQIGYDSQPGAVAQAVFEALTVHRPKRPLPPIGTETR
jgi:hypothetical protein